MLLLLPATLLLAFSAPLSRPSCTSRAASTRMQTLEPDWEQFVPDDGANPNLKKRRLKQEKGLVKAPKPSKVAKHRVACYGCGADLQIEAPAAAGYVEPDRYKLKAQHRQLKLLLCRRCRALSHGDILPAVVEGRLKTATPAPTAPAVDDAAEGGEADSAIAASMPQDAANEGRGAFGIGVTTPEELRAELRPLRDQKILAVLLVDVTDVTGSFLPRVRDLIGGNPIVLVGTKSDLLPRKTDAQSVLAWMVERLSQRLNVIDAHLVSSRTGDGLDDCSRSILANRKGRDTFILGAANVGKSLFVGSFLEHALGARGKRLPISSSTPGTTLRLIGIDCFDGGSMLFDTPGVHLAHRLSASLLPAELKAILPRGKIKPYTPASAAVAGSTFFWGGLVRLDVVEAPLCARLSFVSANSLRVHQVSDTPQAVEAYYAAEVGRTLTPPLSPESAAELGALERTKERLEIELNPLEQAADLSISGLGWVSLGALASLRKATDENAMRMVIDVWVPKGVQVSLRPPMPIAGLPNEPPPPPEENWKDSVFEDRYSDRFSDREYGYD
jgi:nitric-oxide synthase